MEDNWKERLEEFFEDRNRGLQYTRDHARDFFDITVAKTFALLKDELQKHGHRVMTSAKPTSETLYVFTGEEDAFDYRIDAEVLPDRVRVFARASDGRYELTDEREDYVGLSDITAEEIIDDFLARYLQYMQELTAKDWRPKHLSQTA